jgi:membrane-associated phospholipid phosphatase
LAPALTPKRPSRLRPLLRGAATAAIVASVAVPLLRRRRPVPISLTVAAVASGPLAIAVLKPRTRLRDALIFASQMWAFTMVHELPYDEPEKLRARLKVRYPIRIDRVIGGGRLPNARLQRLLVPADGSVTRFDRLLTFAHWAWFFEPHLSLVYLLLRDQGRFIRAARQMATCFDLGCAIYILLPTAPPWWAAANGYTGDDEIERRMVHVGEEVWGRAWEPLFNGVDGNPWAAMPSLHFGASVLAAILLSESSPAAGAAGWTYAGVLGFALVYLGEHYVIDLLAGLGLVAVVRGIDPYAEPLAGAVSRAVQQLERVAN